MAVAPKEVERAGVPVAPAVGGSLEAVNADATVTTSTNDTGRDRGGLTISSKADLEQDLPPQRLVLLVMISVIQGYTLIGPLQHSFKVAMHIGDKGSLSVVFTQAAALVQWGKFAMTLGQNLLFSHVSPLVRVYVAMVGITVGAIIPPLFVFTLGSKWLGWVFLSFGLIGLSLGIFECTFLNVITPLGPLTKSWAIMGFPAAFFIVNVLGFLLVSVGVPVEALFWYIVIGLPVGAMVFRKQIVPQVRETAGAAPHERQQEQSDDNEEEGQQHQAKARRVGTATVYKSILEWQAWLPALLPFMCANIVGHFVMEGALPANFNTFNDKVVPLLGRTDEHFMNKDRFFAVFFIFVGLGDMISRRVGYCFALRTYRANLAALLFGLVSCVFGMYLTTLGIGIVAWLSVFLAFWGQGFNYAVASKYIDRFVPREHNLAAYSFWMFAGSAGAIAGSTTVDVIRTWICHGEVYAHECLAHHGHH